MHLILSLKWYIYRDHAFLVECVIPLDVLGGSFIRCPLRNQKVKEEVKKKIVSNHKRGTWLSVCCPCKTCWHFTVLQQLITWEAFTHAKALYQVSSPHRNRRTESSMSDMFMSASLQISHESRTLSIAGSPPERRPKLKYELTHGGGPVALSLALSCCHTHTNTLTHSHAGVRSHAVNALCKQLLSNKCCLLPGMTELWPDPNTGSLIND